MRAVSGDKAAMSDEHSALRTRVNALLPPPGRGPHRRDVDREGDGARPRALKARSRASSTRMDEHDREIAAVKSRQTWVSGLLCHALAGSFSFSAIEASATPSRASALHVDAAFPADDFDTHRVGHSSARVRAVPSV